MINLIVWLLARLAGLPKPHTRKLAIQGGIRIPMPDGALLVADRYYPAAAGGERLPVLLNRTPYGRMLEGIMARMMAQRGYQVLVVSCRGTFGSQGKWEPFFNEAADGKAVLAWVSQQPWFSGKLGTFGGSYHGLTQWAVLEEPPPFLGVACVMQSQSNFASLVWPRGTFRIADLLLWLSTIEFQEAPLLRVFAKQRGLKRRLRAAVDVLPAANCDEALIGRPISAFQDWLAHPDIGAGYWTRIDFGKDASRVPPMLMVAGWYDLFCAGQLEDFTRLRAAGRPVRLVVGPWWHGQSGGVLVSIRETLEWVDAHFQQRPQPAHSVRLFDMGTRQWRDHPDWPLPSATRSKWYFQNERKLGAAPPVVASIDRYRYDPDKPTPVAGGIWLNTNEAGPRDNRAVEARPDVLTFTSEALDREIAVIGTIHATLYARSSLDHCDFFVRLCDVHPNGRSINLADGIVRMSPGNIARAPDGSFPVRVELTPTANTFRRGHRIRVQVASGAHPLYSRNPGTGEHLPAATAMRPADLEILCGPDHPSAIDLSIVN